MKWLKDSIEAMRKAAAPEPGDAVKAENTAVLNDVYERIRNGTLHHDGGNATVGHPAMLRAIRLKVDVFAMAPIIVYRTKDDNHRERATDTRQYDLFHRRPNDDLSSFELREEIAAALIGYGNFYAKKVKHPRLGVLSLEIIDPRRVTKAERNTMGQVVYTITNDDKTTETLGRSDLLHIPFIRMGRGDILGVSPITLCRVAVQAGMNLDKFLASFYKNGALPGGALKFPERVTQDQANEIIAIWNLRHQGTDNAGKVGILGGGADWVDVGMSMSDAQFVETQRFTVEQSARIIGLPLSLVGAGGQNEKGISKDEIDFFVKFDLGPMFKRVAAKLHTDDDLFPAGSDLFPEFLDEGLLQASFVERVRAYKDARQGGWITANEVRRIENYPPVDGGDQLQQTVVGGAPNQQVNDQPNTDPAGGTDVSE